MIFDRIDNAPLYGFLPFWEETLAFLKTLDARAEDRTYEIRGRDLYANVFGYDTVPRERAALEAHRDYIDVQALLFGAERIGWYPRVGLTVSAPYAPERDAEFYAAGVEPSAWLSMSPGTFAVFLPDDAHLTQVMTGESAARVKKVVVKIRCTGDRSSER